MAAEVPVTFMVGLVEMGGLVDMPATPRSPMSAINGVPAIVVVAAMIVEGGEAEPADDRGYGALVEFLAVHKVVDGDGGHVLFL